MRNTFGELYNFENSQNEPLDIQIELCWLQKGVLSRT